MKNFFIGLVTGLILCVAAGILAYPNLKQTAHDEGYAAGMKKGEETGKAAGIVKGQADMQAAMNAKHEAEVAAAKAKAEEQARIAKAKARVKVVKPTQNWHVIDGKISEPVVSEPEPKEKKKEEKAM